jgi:hypothetical protein
MPSRNEPASLRCVSMLLCMLLVACGTHDELPATPDELSSVRNGVTVAVVMRLDGEVEGGKPLAPFQKLGRLGLQVGDEETGGTPSKNSFPGYLGNRIIADPPARFLSREARDEGWFVLFLRPGFYYVNVRSNTWYLRPQWRLEVPPKIAVIYVGTFYLYADATCTGLDDCKAKDLKLIDQTDQAAVFARRDLGSLPAPVTRLMMRHSGPYRFGIPAAKPDLTSALP